MQPSHIIVVRRVSKPPELPEGEAWWIGCLKFAGALLLLGVGIYLLFWVVFIALVVGAIALAGWGVWKLIKFGIRKYDEAEEAKARPMKQGQVI